MSFSVLNVIDCNRQALRQNGQLSSQIEFQTVVLDLSVWTKLSFSEVRFKVTQAKLNSSRQTNRINNLFNCYAKKKPFNKSP